LESLINDVQSLDPLLIYLLLFAMAFLENLFPPSPSDMMIVLGGALAGLGRIGFAEALLCATAGSVSGFFLMYKIGDWFGDHILERGKIKFIKVEAVHKVEGWFREHGYWVIVVNRFLTGTRAVVSFFAGMSEMKLWLTIGLCAVSALIWNAILVTGGFLLGQNWDQIGYYLSTYSRIVTGIVVLVVAVLLAYYFLKRKRGGAARSRGAEDAVGERSTGAGKAGERSTGAGKAGEAPIGSGEAGLNIQHGAGEGQEGRRNGVRRPESEERET
jgi:membrane protein DedA with SNARE-associated domain